MTAKSSPKAKRKPRAKPKSRKPRNESEDFPLETSGEWTDEHTRVIAQLLVNLEDKQPKQLPGK